MRIAIIGGTGKLGPGLARHFAAAGHTVLIGSRDAAKAEQVASDFDSGVTGLTNLEAASRCDVAVITIPYASVPDTVRPLAQALAGKVVVSTVVPLTFAAGSVRPLAVTQGSAAQEIAALLPESSVCAAFHSVSSTDLVSGESLHADSLVCADDDTCADTTAVLVQAVAGLRPIRAGGLDLAGACEQMTAVLLSVNKRYKVHAGLQLTGI
jgi:8-hydroxy-5-deazaflavin:NADPH oxidoreductase